MKKLSLLLVLCLLLGALAGCGDEKKVTLEDTISGTSAHYSLDNAMMAYMLYDFISQNQYYLVYYYGMKTDVDLREQNQTEGVTWFDYLMDNYIKTQAEEMVAMASMAKAKGIDLTADDQKRIDDYMKSLYEYALKEGYSSVDECLSEQYAEGITATAVRRCLELQLLASNYYAQVRASFTYTDDQLRAHADANKTDFYQVDYIYYIFEPTLAKDATDEEKAAALAASKAEAEALLNGITDEQSFKDKIVELEKEAEAAAATTAAETTAPETSSAETTEGAAATTNDGTTAPETTAESVAETSRSETAEDTTGDETTVPDTEKPDEEYLEGYIVKGEGYYEGDFGEWAFDESRQAGDKKIIDITSGSGDKKEVVGYAVCYLTKPSYLDESATKDVRHILFTKDVYGSDDAARIKAEEILQTYLAGERTAEAFGALAKQYTEDTNGDVGGLYENVYEGQMVTEFNNWIFDPGRQVGDTGIVKTSYGYHVMYHVGDGDVLWMVDAKEALVDKDYKEFLETAKKTYPVTFDKTGLDQIPG